MNNKFTKGLILSCMILMNPAVLCAQDFSMGEDERGAELQVREVYTVQAEPPAIEPPKNKNIKKSFVTLTLENDMFGSGSDQNYTNGLRIGWFDLKSKPPGWNDDLQRYLPFLKTNETTSTFYSLGQNMYTPEAVESSQQDPNDRPWAGFLYGSVGMASLIGEHVDEYEVTLGIVGPWALGEKAQKEVHNLVDSTNPNGWDNQLKNEPGVMLSWQRRWPGYFEMPLDDEGLSFGFTPHAGFTVGNVYTYANAGGAFVLSSHEARWVDKPFQPRPAMPGTGFFVPALKEEGSRYEWELFAGGEVRAIAQNIFLDGNTFRDSHSVDKRYFVADISAGASLIYDHVRVSYVSVYRTREFKGQDEPSVFGGISVGFNF